MESGAYNFAITYQQVCQCLIMARKKRSECGLHGLRGDRDSPSEPIQYVPPEEKKTVVEAPPREEPREGKEGGVPECVREKRPPQCTRDRQS
jgi:hypothetical protein